jgi:Fe-S cluster assembly ATP-binding protein
MSLKIRNLSVRVDVKQILDELNIEIEKNKIHVLMGPNGSGKSTLAAAVLKSPVYKITSPGFQLFLDDKDITSFSTDERAKAGLFLGFQNPVSVPGVSIAQLLRAVYELKLVKHKKEKRTQNPALSVWDFHKKLIATAESLEIKKEFLGRGINDDFSGGEKKKLEMLQALILKPKYAIFDEIDTGLDVDALKIVAQGINVLKKDNCGILLITHYKRILQYVKTDRVHILIAGKIRESGDASLVEEVEKNGYNKWL